MRGSVDRILTTHVGALPIPPGLWSKQGVEESRLRREVADIVRLQREVRVDIVNEGELTKGGNWVSFINQRLTGFVPVDNGATSALLMQSVDWKEFKDFYQAALAGGTLFESTRSVAEQIRELDWSCTSAITYVGQKSLQQEIDSLRAALGGTPPSDAFLTSTAPASLEPGRDNQFYKDTESFLFALADSMAVEYEAIAQAGFIVQIDDAWLAALWDRIGIPMGLEGYRRYCRLRIEALNHALRNVPQSQVRYHLCWGSWHGPHTQDIGMKDMIDLLLSINAQAYLFEAANARHEHEYTLWTQVKIPEDKILIPGVVSHATTVVEHPELVSMRIQRFTNIVGRERVIAGTDCGLGLRCHPQVAWAKLRALSEGAALASQALWNRPVAT